MAKSKRVHDFEINQKAHKVFARHKIDLSRLNIASRGGVLYVEGMVLALGDDNPQSVPVKTMEIVDLELHSIEGVVRIRYNLLNMSKTDTGWQHIRFIKSEKKLVWRIGKGGDLVRSQDDS